MHPVPTRSSVRYLLVDRAKIGYLRFTLEAYEGIATVSTIDPALGLVRISMAPGCETDVERVLAAESERLQLRPVAMADETKEGSRHGV
ncbi:MAG: DUF4911 domain-containing protein [Syntrophobacteraceae bacterium]